MPTQPVPNGWKKVKLGEVVDLMQGFAVNKKTNHYISDKGLPLLKISDLINNTETLFVKEDIPKKFIVNENDIIFSRTGQVGLVFTGKKGVIYNNCFKVIPKGIDKDYLFWWLRSSYVKHMANILATGSAQPDLNHDAFKSIEIIVPENIKVQRKVASILSKYDELIENNNKRIKILEKMGKAIFDDMMKQAGEKRELEEVKVKDIIIKIPTGKKYSSKTVSKNGKVPVLDQGRSGIIGYHNDEPGVIASPDNPVITFANHTCYQNLIMFPFSTIQNVFAFVPKHGLDIYWLYYATKGLISFYDYKGHFPEFLEKKAFIPKNLSYSKKFGEIASKLHKEIYNFKLQNQNLKQTRDLLIPRLVSGKLDVEEIEIV